MPTKRLLQALGQLLTPPEGDGALLARFVACRDEAAFAALVRRHGPMVLGVCRRVLCHIQDAEDAFQAAFLVLARKAGSVLKSESVGSWLYGVAHRTALKRRTAQARRRAREKQVDAMPHAEAPPAEGCEWLPLLDEELNRLPEQYRAPVVLCDLEGLTYRQAARQLKLTDGTLSRRLTAGRRLLAARLSRRGVTLSGGALAAALAQGAASAQVPGPLVVATAKVAVGGLAAASPAVAALAQGVLRAMFLTKLKVLAGMVALVVALGAGGVAYRTAAAQTVQAPKGAAGRPQNELEALRKEVELLRLNLLVVLEKVRAQEAELNAFRKQPGVPGFAGGPARQAGQVVPGNNAAPEPMPGRSPTPKPPPGVGLTKPSGGLAPSVEVAPADTARRAKTLLRAAREARDDATRRQLLDALEQVLRRLSEQQGRAGAGVPPDQGAHNQSLGITR